LTAQRIRQHSIIKKLNEAIFSQPYIKPNVTGGNIAKTAQTTLTKNRNELVYYNKAKDATTQMIQLIGFMHVRIH